MICIFDHKATSFNGNGLCALDPIVCTVSEEAGGSYELHMEHPMDENGKFLLLQEDMIIRAPVPKRVIPRITLPTVRLWKTTQSAPVYSVLPVYKKPEVDSAVQAVKADPSAYAWSAGKAYNKGALVTYGGNVYRALVYNFAVVPTSAASVWSYVCSVSGSGTGGQGQYTPGTVIETLAADELISKLADYNATYIRVRTLRGNVGYIERSKCQETTQEQSGQVIPSRTITEQLFRIYEVEGDDDEHTVTVNARHISYDYAGNALMDCKVTDADPMTAIAIMQGSLVNKDDRNIICNITGKKVTQDWSFQNPVSAMLDTDGGLINDLNAAVIRDNDDFFLLDNSNPRTGITIQYGANMLGVTWRRNIENLVTRIMPRANAGTDGYIYLNNLYVDSAAINDYAYPHTMVMDCQYTVGEEYEKADGTKEKWTESGIRSKMLQDAQKKYSDEKVDVPEISLEVNFVLLGDTEEYRQYRGLQSVLLYDLITIKTGPSGITATAQITEYEYDCLMEVYNAIKVGSVYSYSQRVPGYRVVSKSITYDKLSVDLINRIRTSNASASTNSESQGSTPSGGTGIGVIDSLASTSTTDALSANQGRVLNGKIVLQSYEDKTFSGISFSAGTIGTRAAQYSYTPTKTPIALTIVDVGNSNKINPVAYISQGTVYLNVYRCVSDDVSGNSVKVRVFYSE